MARSSHPIQAPPERSIDTTGSQTTIRSTNKAKLPPLPRHPLPRPGPGRSRLGRAPGNSVDYSDNPAASSGCERELFENHQTTGGLRAEAPAVSEGVESVRKVRPRLLRSQSWELRQYLAQKLLDSLTAQGGEELLSVDLVNVHVTAHTSPGHRDVNCGYWQLPGKGVEGKQSMGLFVVNVVLLLASLCILLAAGAVIIDDTLKSTAAPTGSSSSAPSLTLGSLQFPRWHALPLPTFLHRYLPFKPERSLKEQRSFLAGWTWNGNSYTSRSLSREKIGNGEEFILDETIVVQNDVVADSEEPAVSVADVDWDGLGFGTKAQNGLSRKLLSM